MRTLLYAAVCVAVPSLWGLTMYWVFSAAQKRARLAAARRGQDGRELPPIDYSI